MPPGDRGATMPRAEVDGNDGDDDDKERIDAAALRVEKACANVMGEEPSSRVVDATKMSATAAIRDAERRRG